MISCGAVTPLRQRVGRSIKSGRPPASSLHTIRMLALCRHSHTEIADRLFGLLKKLFPHGDAAHRVGGVPSFAALERKLIEEFQDCPEDFALEYHWASWDLDSWLSQMAPVDKSLFDGKLARISFDNVFRYEPSRPMQTARLPCRACGSARAVPYRYEYLGPSHDWHGGVKVTYKDRLSRVETSSTAEWSPIKVITVPGPTPGSAAREREVTEARGVRFIPYPPDLRKEPTRDPWDEERPKQGEERQRTVER